MVQESIDTTTSGGKLIFHVFVALAEFEFDERAYAGRGNFRAQCGFPERSLRLERRRRGGQHLLSPQRANRDQDYRR